MQIRKLEETLGCRLVDRTTRDVALTDAGQVFANAARETLERLQRGVDEAPRAARGEVGTLTIAYAGSTMFTDLPERIRAYRDTHPRVNVRMIEIFSSRQFDALRAGRADVAVARDPADEAGITRVDFMDERFVLALPAANPLAGLAVVPIRALAGEPILLFPRSAHPRIHDRLSNLFAEAGFSPTVAQETSEWLTAVTLVGAGIGIAFVPDSFRRLGREGVVYREFEDNDVRTSIAVCHRQGDSSSFVRDFVAMFD